MDLDDCRQLLDHCEWADSRVWAAIVACGKENDELRAKLHHLHTVQWAYLNIWRAEPVAPPALDTFPTLAAIRDWARGYYAELPPYLASLPGEKVLDLVTFPWADRLVEKFGKARPATWGQSVTQVVLHSGHHRGQVTRRLRELGTDAPLVDFIAWVWQDRPRAGWE